MANKKNGRWAVIIIFGSVLLASLTALIIFKRINANIGKPPRSAPAEAPAIIEESPDK